MIDLTNPNSLDKAKEYFNKIKEEPLHNNIPIIIVANKCDLNDERKVSKEEVTYFQKEVQENRGEKNKVHLFETSAKNNINIKEVRDAMIENAKLKPEDVLKEKLGEYLKLVKKEERKGKGFGFFFSKKEKGNAAEHLLKILNNEITEDDYNGKYTRAIMDGRLWDSIKDHINLLPDTIKESINEAREEIVNGDLKARINGAAFC